jgi:hypothetical protein
MIKMAACGFPELTQIKTGYAARWRDLHFSVESERLCWRLQIQLQGQSQPLYQAFRSSASQAMNSAAEFAAFHAAGSAASPETVASSLAWKQHW